MKTKASTIYRVTTAILAVGLLMGGILDLARERHVAEIVNRLGYPTYLLTIIGIWKVLGAIALIVPGFPRLKEWAYAGIVFEMTGAAASHTARGESVLYVVAPLLLAILAFISWMYRPQSRTLGAISFPTTEPAQRFQERKGTA